MGPIFCAPIKQVSPTASEVFTEYIHLPSPTSSFRPLLTPPPPPVRLHGATPVGVHDLATHLNRDILGPPDDGKIIILDNSNDDDEAQEKTIVEIESTVASASADDTPTEARIDNSDDQWSD
jgi:hypothetical protein